MVLIVRHVYIFLKIGAYNTTLERLYGLRNFGNGANALRLKRVPNLAVRHILISRFRECSSVAQSAFYSALSLTDWSSYGSNKYDVLYVLKNITSHTILLFTFSWMYRLDVSFPVVYCIKTYSYIKKVKCIILWNVVMNWVIIVIGKSITRDQFWF